MTSSTDPTARPHPDPKRPSPDVDRYEADGQSQARAKGASDEQGGKPRPAKGSDARTLDAPNDQGEGDNIPGP